jgi:uncharacterized membrane protein YgcG
METMKKRWLLSGLGLLVMMTVQAQNIVKGSLRDQENKAPVRGATVIIRSTTDTTFSLSTFSDSSGRFQFNSPQSDSFTLRISSVGFESLVQSFRINGDKDFGIIVLPRTSKELTGITVIGRPPLATQKGDTVEFNAGQIKVNPDASAEDLTKKVPGITVENGQVKAQGENVRRVTVDGRELFGDDATAALRNLPAEIIDKIQVFDRLSDQAQVTGFNDGNTEKEINIVTKANMRNGQYGRVYAGYGTDSRYLAGGNATILKNNRRISVVGLVNNVNQQNFSSQDLLGITSSGGGSRGGSGNFRGGGGGGGQRGGGNFGGGGFGGGANNFFVGQQNGINKTNAFGLNYSDYWGKKFRISGSYFFNNSDNTTNQSTNTQYFSSTNPSREQTTLSNSENTNHRFNLRLEYKIDSFNQIIFTPNISFQNNNANGATNTSTFFNKAQMQSETMNNSSNNRSGNNINNNLLYSHLFRKKGRTFSINLNTSYNKRDGETYQDVLTRIYLNGMASDTTEERRYTDQYNNSLGISANVSYTEPVSKNAQLQLNYNPSYIKSKSEQEVFDYDPISAKYSSFNDSLANVFDNITKAQNGGIAYRYGTNDKQFSVGLNYQQTELENERTYPKPLNTNKRFNNLLPNAMMRFKLSPRSNIRVFYRTFTNTPSVTQLQDVTDVTNRPTVSEGNPNLKQQYSHMLRGNYTFTNTAKGFLFVGNVFVQKQNDYITNATYIATQDSLIGNGQTLFKGEQLTKPINLDGYLSFRSFLTFAVPLKFIKSNLNMNGGVTYTKQPGLINYQTNESQNYTYTLGTVIASNVSQYVDFTVSYSANFSKVSNEITPELNNDYFSHVASVQFNLLSKQGWFFQNDLNNQWYKGLSEGFNQNYWLWNMSAGKKFLKSRKAELKLSVFDLLKQNRSITRNVTESYVQDITNQVLRQYFMLTFTYNLRNFGTAARNNNNRGSMRMNSMF